MKKMGMLLTVILIISLCGGCGLAMAENGETGGSFLEGNVNAENDGAGGNQQSENNELVGNGDQSANGNQSGNAITAGQEASGNSGIWSGIVAEPESPLGVSAEDGQGTYPTYQVEVGQLPGELVKEVLLSDRDISIKTADPDSWYTNQLNEFYHCKDGTYLENSIGELLFMTSEAEYWPEPWMFLEADFLQLVFPDGQDLVLAQADWDYGTMQQAKQLVAGHLDELGVEYGSEWIAFGVSGEKMTEAMHDAYPDGQYPEDLVEGISRLGKPTWKKTYDAADDVYIFRIPLALEGHLLTDAEMIQSKRQSQAQDKGCFIYAMVGREGLRYLEIHQLYTVVGQSEAQALITKEQAIQATMDYIAAEDAKLDPGITTTWTREVMEVKFSYVPAIEKDKSIAGEVFPCWEVRCALSYNGGEWNGLIAVYNVNAVTGEVVSTSSWNGGF